MPYKDPKSPKARANAVAKVLRWRAKPEKKDQYNDYMRAYRKRPEAFAKDTKRRYLWHERNKDLVAKRGRERWQREKAEQEVLAGRPRPEACEICGSPGDKHGIVYDHCHARGHFRGWLCGPCNRILGLAGDDPQRLLKLAAYLRRTQVGTGPQLVLAGV